MHPNMHKSYAISALINGEELNFERSGTDAKDYYHFNVRSVFMLTRQMRGIKDLFMSIVRDMLNVRRQDSR